MAATSGRFKYDDPVNDKFMVDVLARLSSTEESLARLTRVVRDQAALIERLRRA